MATIVAKLNPRETVWNPLDPDNWIGGVVPGPNDIAKFYTYTVNSTYEQGYPYFARTHYYDNNATYVRNRYDTATNWQGVSNGIEGFHTASFWSDLYSREFQTRNWSGSWDPSLMSGTGYYWRQGSNYPYGSAGEFNKNNSSIYTYYGDYGAQHGYQYRATYKSWALYLVNSYRSHYASPRSDSPHYGPMYYRFKTYMYYVQNVANTSLTIDGVSTGEVDSEIYTHRARPFGVTKDEFAASVEEGGVVTDRMVDLFTGSALHVSNGGKWHIWGPHNGRGPQTARGELNENRYFTIAMYTASDSYSPSISDSNLYQYNYSGTTVSNYHLGLITASSDDINASLANVDFPVYVNGDGTRAPFDTEGTSSFRFSTRFGNELDVRTGSYTNIDNQNNPNSGWQYSLYTTSSHGSSAYLDGMGSNYTAWQGIGPGNLGRFRLKHDGTFGQNSFIMHDGLIGTRPGQGVRIDRTFTNWVTSSRVQHPMVSRLPYTWEDHGNAVGLGTVEKIGGWWTSAQILKQGQAQYWELTGSQVWNVGRIELGRYQHFHVKDDAKIVLHDMQGSSNGTNQSLAPTIDFETNATRATLFITDEATIEISSSRTSFWNNDEPGIYLRRNSTSLIVSGSANYSSSKVTNATSAGSSTIEINNLSNTFSPGDIISIESTGSFVCVFQGSREHALDFVDQNDKTTWYSGSYEELYYRSSGGKNEIYVGGSTTPKAHKDALFTAFQGHENPTGQYFDHAVHTDEIVTIAATSSNTATIRKFFGKEGEIKEDMGLYNRSQFIDTFPSGGIPNYTHNDSKRVVLVDSNHKKFAVGDQLEISGSVYTVIHNTTYLSQSLFRDFSRSDNPSLEDMFYLRQEAFSGSSIWPIDVNADGQINTSTEDEYHFERIHKNKLLITGSYQGSRKVYEKYGNLGVPQLKNSGSSNGYRALRLDPTLAWGWQSSMNLNYDNLNHDSYNYRFRYYVNNVWSTWYASSHYLLKNTDNFEEGEIIVSGSLLRDGFMDPTSSTGYWHDNSFGLTYGNTVYEGPPMSRWDGNVHQGKTGYNHPYPYSEGFSMNSQYYGMLYDTTNNGHSATFLSSRSDQMQYMNTNPGYPYRYSQRGYGKTIEDDPDSGDFSLDGWMNDHTASYYKVTQSIEDKRAIHPDKFGGSGKLRVRINDNIAKAYVDDGRGNELMIHGKYSNAGRGPIGLQMYKFGSIHSVNVKEQYQQLILDTTDSFNERDKIYESRLLYDHYANKDVKFLGTLVTDAKGHKNLLWEYMRTKGNTDILPYVFGACNQGTTAAGNTNTNRNYGGFYNHIYSTNYNAIIPKNNIGTSRFSRYQANDNFYVIYDLGTQVTFDTIGMIFCKDTYGFENATNNQMNNVEFQVCDDVGVASPAWEIVRAKANDIRYSNYRGGIRFYTFPSGSVNKRYVKYHSRGGTNSTAFAMHSHFGIYNFSGSCAASNTLDASSVAGGFADQFGSPTASMCQIELASTKNWKTGDMIYFWSKQMNSSGNFHDEQYNVSSYYNTNGVTGFMNGTTPEAQIINGKWPIYTITNIQGNIVTLDRPITQMFIDAGTIAYKYNRGNVTFKSPRTMLFNIGFFYNNYVRRTLRNITGINALPTNYSATYYGMYSVEDAGVMPYHYNANGDGWYKPHGLYKNIYSSNFPIEGTFPRWDTLRAKKVFNLHLEWVNNSYGSFGSLTANMPNSVISFCKAPNQNSYNTRITIGHEYGQYAARGHVYYQNNWTKGDRYSSVHVNVDNARFGTNNNHLIHIGDIITVDNEQAPTTGWWPASRVGGYNRTMKGEKFDNYDYNLIQWYTWWNPYATNKKTNPSHVRHNAYSDFASNNMGSYFSRYDRPYLMKKNQQNTFGNRDLLVQRETYYTSNIIVQGDNFDNDKMYELYSSDTYAAGMSYSTANIFIPTAFKSEFSLLEAMDIRLDLSMVYEIPPSQVYAANSQFNLNSSYGNFGNSMPVIVVENLETMQVLFSKPLHRMSDTLNMQEVFSLPKGHYRILFRYAAAYRTGNPGLIMRFKDLKFNIVSTDSSKIIVLHSNWDKVKMLEQPSDTGEHYASVNTLPYTDSTGQSAVKRQVNDLTNTKTIKFNKVKL